MKTFIPVYASRIDDLRGRSPAYRGLAHFEFASYKSTSRLYMFHHQLNYYPYQKTVIRKAGTKLFRQYSPNWKIRISDSQKINTQSLKKIILFSTVSKQNDAPPGSLYCVPKTGKKGKNIHNLTGCPGNTTCCLNGYSNSFVGCCMLKDAMDCGDNWHCCPKGTVCDPGCTGKSCVCRKAPWESKASRTAFSLLMKALNSFWNKIAKNYPSLEKSW